MQRKILIMLATITLILGLVSYAKLNYFTPQDNDTTESLPQVSLDLPAEPEIVHSPQVANVVLSHTESGAQAFEQSEYLVAIEHFKKGLENGESISGFYLGWMATHGLGQEKNLTQAAQWFERCVAQKQADTESDFCRAELGRRNFHGEGVAQNKPHALELFEASKNNPLSAYYLAQNLISTEPEKAEAHLERVIRFQGAINKELSPQNRQQKEEYLAKHNMSLENWRTYLREQNDFYAKFNLPELLRHGSDCCRSARGLYAHGRRWNFYLAQNGNAQANFAYGRELNWSDPIAAKPYLEKALALGILDAQQQLQEGEWQHLRKTIRETSFQGTRCVLAVFSEQRSKESELYRKAIASAPKGQNRASENVDSIAEDLEKEKEARIKACYKPLEAIAQVAMTSEDAESLYDIATDRHLKKNRPITETIQLLKSAAEKGNIFAAQHLGELYYYGLEYSPKYAALLQKYDESRQRKKTSSEFNSIDLVFQDDFYRNGEVKQDISQALYWFEQSQKPTRSFFAENYIAELSFLGKGVPRDLAKAQDEITKDAEAVERIDPNIGDGRNSLYQALIYSDIENPQRNIERAITALDKAVERNSVPAKVYRAHLSWFGHDVPLDTSKFTELFQNQDRRSKKTPLAVALWVLSGAEKFLPANEGFQFESAMVEDFESGGNALEQAYLGIAFGIRENSPTDSAKSEKWLMYARKNGVLVNKSCTSLSIDPERFPHLGSLANERTFDANTSALRCAALLDHLARLSTLRTMIEQTREVFWNSYNYRAQELLDAYARFELISQGAQNVEAISGEHKQNKGLYTGDPETDRISQQIEEAVEKRMRARKAKQ